MASLPSYGSLLKQTQAQSTVAIKPQVASLQAYKPAINEQYQATIKELKAGQEEEVGREKRVISREFGRRGIPLSSGVFDTTMQEKLAPINRYWAGKIAGAGSDRTSALLDLAAKISGVRSGAIQNAISNALSLYGTKASQWESAQDRALKEKLARMQASQSQSGMADFQKYLQELRNIYGGEGSGKSTFKPVSSVSIEDLGGQKNNKYVSYEPAPNLYDKFKGGWGNIGSTLWSNIKGSPTLLKSFFGK